MNERLVTYTFSLSDPVDASNLAASAAFWVVPFSMTIVHVSVAPYEDDGSATIDINDDGTGVITAIDASDHDVPGTWSTTHYGGTNTPVSVAAGSEMSIDVNSGAAGNRFDIVITALAGS